MTSTRAADIVARRLGIPKAAARAVVSEFLRVLCEQIVQQDTLKLRGFCTIVTRRQAFTIRHPRTQVPARQEKIVLSIRPSKALRQALNALTGEPNG